jgi:hypothetical protein
MNWLKEIDGEKNITVSLSLISFCPVVVVGSIIATTIS